MNRALNSSAWKQTSCEPARQFCMQISSQLQNDVLLLVSPMHWSVCMCKCASVDIACAHFAYRIAFNALIFQAATGNTVHNTHLSNLILHKLFMLINLCCDQMVFLWISLLHQQSIQTNGDGFCFLEKFQRFWFRTIFWILVFRKLSHTF